MSDNLETQVRDAQNDANALFVKLQEFMIKYMHEVRPGHTGVALALVDLLVVWTQAMGAPEADIAQAFHMCWLKTTTKPADRINSIRKMDKHAN